ncbi:BLUF domain-containing protein [uncultured Aquimarina sp.]|uniref:BLUF domain-containing protein n=1 Tax=uncultured Aquimarina sp. TaxID=575652 RepID=UPI0026144823|nr:BLUF domain-containing protein [uncultured Aquimarina sp.]
MWHTISYVSSSLKLSDFQINDLMHCSKLKNEYAGINGILMHSGQNFFQIIEGEKKIIQELYSKIEKDSRHSNLIKIFDRQIRVPSFKIFHNSYVTVHREKDYSELQQFLEKERSNNPDTFNSVSYLTNKFMQLP